MAIIVAMQVLSGRGEKICRVLTRLLALLIVCWGAAMVMWEIKPFWIDEWRLICNLKFKTPSGLWGPLDYTQQFPRVYLQLLKSFTTSFDYSYFSLRAPAYLVSLASIFLCFRLMRRFFSQGNTFRWLFVLILLSSQTFTDYLVQTKHYEMEIFLSLVALWQLRQLTIAATQGTLKRNYFLLCSSMLLAPFFSYTYPIAAAPLFIVVLLQGWVSEQTAEARIRSVKRRAMPLALLATGIVLFYFIDVSQLMADENMHRYWQARLTGNRFDIFIAAKNIWALFARVGSGLIFEIVFGILGLTAFLQAVYRSAREVKSRDFTDGFWLRVYCLLLIMLVIMLFLAGKLPVGEAKFTAFTVPAISILIVFLLEGMYEQVRGRKLSLAIAVLLFLGLSGNILSTIINTFTAPEYSRRILVYRRTEQAIELAQRRRMPIFVTPGVAYPDQITRTDPFLMTVTSDCVLRTFPAYNAELQLSVIAIPSLDSVSWYRGAAGMTKDTILAGDGLRYRLVP